jgi:hypothetical protein
MPLPRSAAPQEPAGQDRDTGAPRFTDLVFCARVMDDGRPIHPTSHIAEGADTVFATFEYRNMQRDTPWSMVWMSGGRRLG